MSKSSKVPDAWDDDWISKADQPTPPAAPVPVKLSKAERRAQQAELNKKLWEEAEAPKNPYFVETRNDVPLKSEFKPAVKVLSRKPAPAIIARTDPSSGLEQLTIEDDEDEEDESHQKTLTMEERQAKAQKEREEKQKKYEEARQRLFGSSEPTSGSSSPRKSASPAPRAAIDRGRGRGRGNKENRPESSSGNKNKQLFDPNYTPKPDSLYIQKRDPEFSVSGPSTPSEESIVRSPRGPDGSGRGGFGFASRGGRGA